MTYIILLSYSSQSNHSIVLHISVISIGHFVSRFRIPRSFQQEVIQYPRPEHRDEPSLVVRELQRVANDVIGHHGEHNAGRVSQIRAP